MVGDRFSFQYRRYYTYIQPILADPIVRSYFGVIASIFLITFLIVFALSPTINTIIGLQKKIADQKEVLKALTTKTSALVAAQSAYAQVEDQIYLLDQALPKKPSPSVLIYDINTIASRSAVAIKGLQFKPIQISSDEPVLESANEVSTLDFTFSVSGSKENVITFLTRLENTLLYIREKNIAISIDTEAAVKNNVIVDVSAINYYLP